MTEHPPFTNRVVVGIDDSDRSLDAVRWAGAYAHSLGTEVTILHG